MLIYDGTDRRTPDHDTDPAPHIMWAASISVQKSDSYITAPIIFETEKVLNFVHINAFCGANSAFSPTH